MCYAPVQIWMPQLLRYGGVASRVAVRARAQLLKEADSRSNRVGSRRVDVAPSGRHQPRVVVSTRSRRESYAMHVRRMRRARECTLVTRGGRFTAHARRETARGMLGSTTGRSMLMLALMQVVVQCIIEYEYR